MLLPGVGRECGLSDGGLDELEAEEILDRGGWQGPILDGFKEWKAGGRLALGPEDRRVAPVDSDPPAVVRWRACPFMQMCGVLFGVGRPVLWVAGRVRLSDLDQEAIGVVQVPADLGAAVDRTGQELGAGCVPLLPDCANLGDSEVQRAVEA
jgi:hypothetical protein